MTKDELIYILRNPIVAKTDLLRQLQELEIAGEDPDLQDFLKLQIDQVCGISRLVFEMDRDYRDAIDSVYVLPGLCGKGWKHKPSKQDLILLPDALQALMGVVNEKEWDLSYYESWRQQREFCIKCMTSEPVRQNCWLDPNGIIRKHFHPAVDDLD